MSLCNLGRPPQDAGLQNLVVNDTLHVNKLLKAAKAEIYRLCSDVANPSVTLTGSYLITSIQEEQSFSSLVFPSGPTSQSSGIGFSASPFTAFWTDRELLIDDFRVIATGTPQGSDDPLPVPLNVSIVAAPTFTALNLPPTNGTEIVTLAFTNVVTPSSGVSTTVPARIPAGSYVSIRLDATPNPASLTVAWSLRFSKL